MSSCLSILLTTSQTGRVFGSNAITSASAALNFYRFHHEQHHIHIAKSVSRTLRFRRIVERIAMFGLETGRINKNA